MTDKGLGLPWLTNIVTDSELAAAHVAEQHRQIARMPAGPCCGQWVMSSCADVP